MIIYVEYNESNEVTSQRSSAHLKFEYIHIVKVRHSNTEGHHDTELFQETQFIVKSKTKVFVSLKETAQTRKNNFLKQ